MKTKRWIALAATLLMSATTASTFVGCGSDDDWQDPTKANLYVATYAGGVGREWLDAAAQRFMDMHTESTHFQEGRTGVKIKVVADKTKYAGSYLADRALNRDMYFTESVDYYTFVKRDMVADITDVITADMSDYGEDRTIEDKIDPYLRDFMTMKDEKYYMVPFYSGFYGIIYDVELFEERGFYYDEDGDWLALTPKGDEETEEERKEFEAAKSKGPDDIKGTYDDGLPATYEDFIKLVKYIATQGCIPFCYSGRYKDYVDKAFRSFVTDYEGYDSFNLNYTLNGTTKVVKEIVDDGSTFGEVVLEDVTITEKNAYELQRQPGRYYALKMQEELFGSVKYVGGTFNGFDYTTAQSEFIRSKWEKKPYAMLAEGVWWENEANKVFKTLETKYDVSKQDRRFAFMPIPKEASKVGEQQTMLSANRSFGFINKKCENMTLAKEFMRFLNTDAEMSKFSAVTSIPRSLDYEVTEEDRKTATNYGKSLIDMVASAKVVYPYSSSDFVIANSDVFLEGEWYFTSYINNNKATSPFTAFIATKKADKATAKEYFEGLYKYQKSLTIWGN